MTRAAFCLAEGRFAEALAWNPLLLPGLFAVFLFWIWCLLIVSQRLPAPSAKTNRPLTFALRAVLLLLLVNWLYLLGVFGPAWPGR